MRFSYAIAASVAAHAALAAVLAFCIHAFPSHDSLPELDLSSVEVSFAEEEDDSLPLSPIPPAPPPSPQVPQVSDPPPPDDMQLPLLPPDPDELSMPEPADELPPEMDIPRDPEEKREQTPSPEPESAPSPAAAPRQARVDAPPRPLKAIRPDYPRGARLRGEQGSVVLELSVDERGAVSGVGVADSSGYPELDAAAERAARSARFNPARADGRPVASTARLTLTFKLK